MTSVAPAVAQAVVPAPATAHPASTAHAAGHDRFGFAGVLEGLSASQAKARPDLQNRAQAQAPDQDRRQAPPDAPSELRTASIDAALSSLFAAPMNAPAGEAAGATADTGPRTAGAANPPAAAETQGSTDKPDAPAVDEAVRARLVAERTFILPTTANAPIATSRDPTGGTSRTEAAVTKAPVVSEFSDVSPSAAPLAAISMSRAPGATVAKQGASEPATFAELGMLPLSSPDAPAAAPRSGAYATRGLSSASLTPPDGGNDGLPVPVADAAIASSSDPTAGTSRTGAAVTKAAVAGEYSSASPSAAPLAALSMSRAPGATVAKQGASEPATFAEFGMLPLSSPDTAAAAPRTGAYATRGLSSATLTPPDGGNDGLPVPVADAALTAPTSCGAGGETKPSSGGGAADGRPIPRPPSTKTPTPAAKGEARLASTPVASAASSDRPVAAPPGSTNQGRRPNDWSGSKSGGPTPSAQPGALSAGAPTGLAPVHAAPDAQAAPAAEAVAAPSAAPAVAALAKSPVREIDLDLAPGGLEDVTMTMRLAGDRLSVVIRAASAQTAGTIEGAREAIAERLAAIGQPLGSLVIHQTGGADGRGKAADASGDDGAQAQKQDSGDPRGGARRGSSGF